MPGDKDERQILVQILESCGIWRPEGVDEDALREYLPQVAGGRP